jgi:2-succinyl-5-enolpyruvyl-6-hydroxy-3-cyclohexene-1-carboxylate synthase
MDATTFFTELAMRIPSNSDKDWIGYWQGMDTKAKQTAQSILNDHTYNEFQTVNEIMKHISGTHLHLANSTPVRLADLSGVPSETIEVSANRGTSGIDGCTSTAVGHALVNGRTNVLITGDMAFLYDRNALWHQYKLPNLKIIMLNNHGGGIFRLIDGPRQQPELEEFFVTPQTLSAKNAASDFSLKYLYCNQQQDLSEKLKKLFEPNDHATLLEIEFTQGWKEIYQQLKQSLKEQL